MPSRLLRVVIRARPASAINRSSSNSMPTESGRTDSPDAFTMWVTS